MATHTRRRTKPPTTSFTFRLDEALAETIRELAEREDRTPSYLIRKAVEQHFSPAGETRAASAPQAL